MSLSEAQSVKIKYSTPQDVSDEVLGGAIHFCRDTGYKQTMMMLTLFWSSFLLSEKKTLDENGILDDTLNCYTRSLAKVFPQITEDAELMQSIINLRESYWNQLIIDFDTLQTEAEIVSFIKIADELNKGDEASVSQLKKDPLKSYSQYASNIISNIYCILHDIDNGICIQYKCVLDEFRFARVQQQPKTVSTAQKKEVSVSAPTTSSTPNGQTLGMAWYKFLIYFALIAGAIINLIYSFNYISGGIYFVETNGEISADQVYSYYGTDLQVIDVFYGFFLIAFAILAFVVRHKLANYEPDSLKFIKIFYSLSAGVPFLYAILVAAITGQSLAVQTVTTAIVGLVFLFLNIKYFNKRAHLFVDKTVVTPVPVRPKTQPQLVQKNNEILVANQSTKPTIMFCRKCGTKLHEDSTFCHKCGTKTFLAPDKVEPCMLQENPIEKMAILTCNLPVFVAENSKEKPAFCKNDFTYCDAIIFVEFFVRANALEIAPSQKNAELFSDEYIKAVNKCAIEMVPGATPFFTDMFYSRTMLYDNIVMNETEPIQKMVEVLSHIIHKESVENSLAEAKDKNFRYFGGLIENLAITEELVSLFGCINDCTKEAMDELKEYLTTK